MTQLLASSAITLAGLWVSLGALTVSVVAAAFTGLQYRSRREVWQAQNAFEITRDLQTDRHRSDRRTIFELNGNQVPYDAWTEDEKHIADAVVQRLQIAAYLDEKRLLPERFLQDNWANVFRTVREVTRQRVAERQDLGDTDLWLSFTKLADRLLDIRSADPCYPSEQGDPRGRVRTDD